MASILAILTVSRLSRQGIRCLDLAPGEILNLKNQNPVAWLPIFADLLPARIGPSKPEGFADPF